MLSRRVRRSEQRRIYGMLCSHQISQDERGGCQQNLQGTSIRCYSALSSLSFSKRLCREIIGWKHLSHPNILPLLGVSVSMDPYCFRILTKWMPNGNVMHHAKSNPGVNRLQLVSSINVSQRRFLYSPNIQLFEVASGVAYLHELGIVHGDLKGVRPPDARIPPFIH